MEIMAGWDIVQTARVPSGGAKLTLYKKDEEYSIWIENTELMSSHAHESEDELAHVALKDPKLNPRPQVLIGGLGMGYTLAAALKVLPEGGKIRVAELIPEIIDWNRGPLAHFAGRPLEDTRVDVQRVEVGRLLQTQLEEYDVILLDVDNGPEGLVRGGNDWLYSEEGLDSSHSALKPGGILAVWSAFRDPAFYMRLKKVGFRDVRQVRVKITPNDHGDEHLIWLGRRQL